MSIYDVAVRIAPEIPIGEIDGIITRLEKAGVEVDFETMEFSDGLYFDAGCFVEDVEEAIEGIEGVSIDWESMADWIDDEEDGEE